MKLCRKFKLWKLILLLVFVVIFLQIFHMSLLSKLESKETEDFSQINKVLLEIESKVRKPHRLDKSGTYNVIPNVIQASRRPTMNSENLTIITQCTSNHLHHLVELTEFFQGPISVAVFTYVNDVQNAVRSIAYYHFCNKFIRRFVTFHMVYPTDTPPINSPSWDVTFDCDTPPTNTDSANYAIEGIEYPHNLLRNLALKYSRTSHILVIDIDMIPSPNLKEVFMKNQKNYFLKKTTFISRSAHVVPAFELKNGYDVPKNRMELIDLWEKNIIRPFYEEACWKCQKYTDYDKWRASESELTSAYHADFHDPWEPFYIAAKSVPQYDERFKQYGFNRISQICEMHIAGYQFSVLTDVFLVHKGFKHTQEFHKTKNDELDKNRILFRKFKNELKAKYQESVRRC
ncbi:hypothetical protein SNE40_010533 [Patella caerulea]|uniref:Beta-1,4-glucuronyltransferase 1 n=2 Tax=Patella caerulea TaxID=87958 RepID=A0AAN8JYA0_PATCE